MGSVSSGASVAVASFERHGSVVAARKRLGELRELIAERFPERRRRAEGVLTTGFRPVDEACGGGLPRGGVTEVVASTPGSGGQWVVRALLQSARRTHQYLGLIDGADGFDPQSEPPELLPHLLWVRCCQATQALQAADLLVRDGNISLVLLDLREHPASGAGRRPMSVWFRLQRAVERSGGVLVVLSSRTQVSGARVRVELEERKKAERGRERA